MNDEIMKAIEQVASRTEQNRRTSDIEAYIRGAASDIAQYTRVALIQHVSTIPEPTKSEILAWLAMDKERFANQVSEVAVFLLRRELFDEK